MKTINIYLTQEEMKLCRTYQQKYRVSLSTLADKLVFITYKYAKDREKITTEYIGKGFKTSIKPKCLLEETEYLYSILKDSRKRNILATNCVKIFVNREAKHYIVEDKLNNYYAEIDRELQKVIDPNWDYNEQLRKLSRIAKRNPNYFKKLAGID